jgi:hypothetical protein
MLHNLLVLIKDLYSSIAMNKLNNSGECAFYNKINRYNLLECGPQPKQPLQLLYPGRFMKPYYNTSGSNIPNEDMEGLDKSRKISRSMKVAYDMEIEALSRHLGGKDKIYPFPAAAPEAVIQDPRLATMSMMETLPEIMKGNDPSRGFSAEYSEYNDLNKINSVDVDIVNTSRKEDVVQSKNILDDNGILPEYDWESGERDSYPLVEEILPTYSKGGESYIENYENDSQFTENEEDSSYSSSFSAFSVNWILLGIFIVTFLVIAICIFAFM